jgi:hypothetical protein
MQAPKGMKLVQPRGSKPADLKKLTKLPSVPKPKGNGKPSKKGGKKWPS